MRPPPQSNNYERIPVYDDWLNGEIEVIEYDEHHRRTYMGEEKVGPCVRFRFRLDGCKFAHRTGWMSFSYAEKANLYKKYLSELVQDAEPNMDMDLDELSGMKVKTMWSKKDNFDNLEMIRPLVAKIKPSLKCEEKHEDEEMGDDDADA